MGYKGRITLLIVVFATSVEFSTYDYINDLPAVKWDVLGGVILSVLSWWFGKQYDKVRYYSQRDILTGTYNRLYSSAMFLKLLKRVERANQRLNVFVVDINDLKIINDLYGHLTGDKVIQYISFTLMACIRKSDFVTRWGGDEFVIATVRTDEEEVFSMVEQIKEHIFAIKISSKEPLKPSISIGTATYPVDGRSFEDLISVADTRMYSNKNKFKVKYMDEN
jgi:diguanylate cyclase (GGDEF)-like protein